jgi:molybdopterin-containing oxidoreductase family iron-sulfur binding subunit
MSAPFPLPVLNPDPRQAPSRGVGGDSGDEGREFSGAAASPPEGFARREFLQVAGASLAALGLSGCWKTPAETIVAYGHRPPELTPGNALHYATAWTLNGETVGLLVKAREGRPIKVEGNPDHPESLGSTGVLEQAAMLQLYDVGRARRFVLDGQPSDFVSTLKALVALAKTHEVDGGRRLRFLLEPGASPLLTQLRQRITRRFPNTRIDAYSAISRDAEEEGAELAFGRRVSFVPRLRRAQVVVSLERDFLAALPGSVRACRDFAEAREPGPGMNRLYVTEGTMSVTGGFADHRLRLRPSSIPEVALALANQLAKATGNPSLQALSLRPPVGLTEFAQRWATAAARDLARHPGAGVVLVGLGQPAWVHALAHALNEALGGRGRTVDLYEPACVDARTGPAVLARLAQEIDQGQVDTLVVTSHNPAFSAPADLDFATALAKVRRAVYWAHHEEETAAACRTLLPAAHFLECWGDARASAGTASIIQPLIDPLLGGVSEADVLAPFAGVADASTHDLVKALWRDRVKAGADLQPAWEDWLARGNVPGTAGSPLAAALQWGPLTQALQQEPPPPADGLELHFTTDPKVFDGRFASNAWLQELPDPVTKVSWDNAVRVSPATAKRLGIEPDDRLRLDASGRSLEAVAYVLPGQADDVLTLPLGFGGRTSHYGEDQIAGFNAYALRRAASWDTSLSVSRLGDTTPLANTQHHGRMEGRPLALEKTLADFTAHPDALESMRGPPEHLYFQAPKTPGEYQWALTIDLNRCTGCSACVVACQAENNIPCVGKAQVANGREMHWLRLDRYFTGDLENPGMIVQPMACQHCEAAPCEYVCPVNATVHSDEGLNEMVYNRCVGTRYCSNNCPYKVRRFNFLDYHPQMPALSQMLQNPDVTVRARGVMEKCSYCVQRIERARIDTRIAHREIADGEVLTACQQACPTRAITFGTLTDPDAQVSRLRASPRRYDVLGELGTRPRTGYLVRIKNPNPELA